MRAAPDPSTTALGDQLQQAIDHLPPDQLSLDALLDQFGPQGLLLLTALLTLVFLIPVSIPGVSTVFGAGILLVGVCRLLRRPLWLPARLRERQLPADRLRSALGRGMVWVGRLQKISRPHRLPALVDSRPAETVNDAGLVLGALLLMAPFGFVPFSNTLPALAILLLAIGLMQRDGVAALLGHLMNLASIVYFGVLIGGGGLALREALQRLAG
ncbi:exopolysaccharide biosynthesis protein [Pseudoxanthomonas winnipegensis]|uniref:exopolysaccharide biosynthesis protein n=1 Tax=Pseudoxanthomonas winnipegensis TaxID=2480810 RepID=UPI00103A5C04|nr:exopolysaccharide biosynthesis protein [Pseudoxanthomonas winnipegensis]TBV74717.1 exopolysaccharide biosynthesis protein [Pseudoxanthomonas winnipegensis]